MISENCGSKWMLKQVRTVLVLFLSLSLVFTNFTMAVAASEAAAKTKMKHSPPKYFVPEQRIQLDVNVSDPKGVDLVRCYFKAAGETDFVFVPMATTGKNTYSGVLPAPSLTSEQIEYLFLSVNAENVIVKSQVFVLDKENKDKVPAWQEIPMENEIQVGMELDQLPSELAGFSDNIAMDAVESSLRFGIVAGGLYQSSAAATASTTGSAASATTAGTVSAGAAGLSTAGIVGLSALGAVAVGGAAASGGSSGGSSSGENPISTTKTIDIKGLWNYTASVQGCANQETGSFVWSYNGSGYGLSWSTNNYLNTANCDYVGPVSCSDPGPYSANDPISESEFLNGMNSWACKAPGVSFNSVSFDSQNRITFKGISSLGQSTSFTLTR